MVYADWTQCPSLLTFRGPCIVIYSYNKHQRGALSSHIYFGIHLYMFRTDLLSIKSSLALHTQQKVFASQTLSHVCFPLLIFPNDTTRHKPQTSYKCIFLTLQFFTSQHFCYHFVCKCLYPMFCLQI